MSSWDRANALAFSKASGRSPLKNDSFTPSLRRFPNSWAGWLFLFLLAWLGAASATAEVTARRDTIQLPTYPWLPAVPHPFFKATDNRNIYPYPMMDNLRRTREVRTYQTAVLENEFLRITFLPEIGGKVYEVFNKTTGKQMFYVNHVVKPGLIGQCGAWISGGIEFNTGPAGHSVSAMQPVDVEILPQAPDGSRTVAVGETERINHTQWTVCITLRPGRSYLEEKIRIYNPSETIAPYYFWNCTAVPNTHGFRFVYPMTLGTDHGGKEFYTWPVANGKDLSLGRNYQDASSIFAYQCDQDFFGSYDEEANTGIIAYANHHQVPGKKAWTWGTGSYGQMHQMDLTDDDGPYNEVQTGPLPTQADVGRLDPAEGVAWEEWWYPVHGLGGFTFANREVALNTQAKENTLLIRAMGSGDWSPATFTIRKNGRILDSSQRSISPRSPVSISLFTGQEKEPFQLEVTAGAFVLARCQVPLDLPVRKPPANKPDPKTSAEHAQKGWEQFLFANEKESEKSFRQALTLDANQAPAHTGLAFLLMDRASQDAGYEAERALKTNPESGLAHFALAVASNLQGREALALEEAWKSALDPAIAIPGRALAGKLLLRRDDFEGVVQALSPVGPWNSDPACRHRLACALFRLGRPQEALPLIQANLRDNPLDTLARSLLWLQGMEFPEWTLAPLAKGKALAILELAVEYSGLGQFEMAYLVMDAFYLKAIHQKDMDPLVVYWAAYLAEKTNRPDPMRTLLDLSTSLNAEGVFPHHGESVPVLQWALSKNPQDGQAALLLGHLLFSLGKTSEGRQFWQKAAEKKAAPAIAYRALGAAAQQVDGDLKAAVQLFDLGNQADPKDPILAMDLAKALAALADQARDAAEKNNLISRVAKVLSGAFAAGQSRSDFAVLLARTYNRMNQYEKTAKLLDSVRLIIWEGAQEVHQIFEEAHLALGNDLLKAGRASEALAEFDRALEYPQNLATGRLQNTCDSHIHYLRGQALAAMRKPDLATKAWQMAVDQPQSTDSSKEEARQKARDALNKN